MPIGSRIIDQKVLGFRGERSVHVIDTMTITEAKGMNETIDRIAQEILNLHTLDTRHSDALDFHDLAVWRIKEALEAFYAAGRNRPSAHDPETTGALIRSHVTHPKENDMTYTCGNFTIDEIGFIQTADTKVLAAVARGELDLNRIVLEELAARGLDLNGTWVGFEKAREIHNL